ncbi:MAG TPA: AmmeMemoRadiSam system protein B [Candidatus Eisenbacteria bacterium]|nr:AmmeMemoRadiSam system protein B [Candidatus Eisenbacteria bacterium]
MTRRNAIIIALAVAALVASAAFALPGQRRSPLVSVGAAVPRAEYPNPYDDIGPFMAGIYGADHGVETTPQYRVRAAVVPHHLAASVSIASGVKMLSGQPFKRILLLSPDHFHRCPTLLCTADSSFSTFFGEVDAAGETLSALLPSPYVTKDPDLFRSEHGIHAVLPFIAHYFPGVQVTPLVLSQRVPWKAARTELLAVLERAVDDDTMLVVSSDFSHYLPLAAAEEKDELTAKALFAADLDGLAALENPSQSDCPGCLWLLAALAGGRGFYNPSVILHTNAAKILHDESVKETTSHFSMVWYENAALGGGDLAAAGDVTVTRGMPSRSAADEPWWRGDGPRIVNLEGPLASECPARKNPFLFCNEFDRWEAITDVATHWSVENNHMLDLGVKGRRETVRLVREAGESPVTTLPAEDGRFRIIAVTAVINPVPDAASAELEKTQARVLSALAKKRKDELTVVYVHGGEEFSALATPEEERVWERFIDAGADAVLVSHGHVPGDVVIHAGRPIFRGLGNFIFDQGDAVATSTAKLVRLRKKDGVVLFETLLHHAP